MFQDGLGFDIGSRVIRREESKTSLRIQVIFIIRADD